MRNARRKRVHFDTSIHIGRPARYDEFILMDRFARHSKYCEACVNPWQALQTRRGLCERGRSYAREITDHFSLKGRKVYSKWEDDLGAFQPSVEISHYHKVIFNLLDAVKQGLLLKAVETANRRSTQHNVERTVAKPTKRSMDKQREEVRFSNLCPHRRHQGTKTCTIRAPRGTPLVVEVFGVLGELVRLRFW
jgi:hypothetical protein